MHLSKKWLIAQPDETAVVKIARSLSISLPLARLLINRGIDTPDAATAFIEPQLSILHNPFHIPQMEIAVNRVRKAIKHTQRILIHGDYDADGLTATATLYSVLRKYTDLVYFYIPNRLKEGYGLNTAAIHQAKKENIELIITVDCGINAVTETDLATHLGIDLIITDHHEPGEFMPKAVAVLHPNLPNSSYPFPYLAGVGIAFKFAQAIVTKFEKNTNPSNQLTEYLDLVAIGTVSDVVPLLGENRVLTTYGLKQLMKTTRPGLRALMVQSRINNKKLDSWHIAYVLGPRLNAAGRMGDANAALQLLLTDNDDKANYLARCLDDYNKQRQKQEFDILQEAENQIQEMENLLYDRAIILTNDTWHLGVLGIVAGKLSERYSRPIILFRVDERDGERVGIGSARGIPEFHLMQALRQCEHCLKDYGGHKMAAGMTVAYAQLDEFRNQFNAIANKMLAEPQLTPSVSVDAELNVSNLSLPFLEELEKLAPYGNENPEPVFMAQNLELASTPVLIKDKHLKLKFRSQKNVGIEGIGFGWAEQLDELPIYGENYDILFYPRLNNYQGMSSIELKLKDIRKTNMQ